MTNDFRKNKQEILNTIQSIKAAEAQNQPVVYPEIVVFGSVSSFMAGLLDALEKQRDFEPFSNPDMAISYCFDHEVKTVILDMDPPTNWTMSTDVFTNVRTMKPKVHFIVLTKTPQAVPIRTIAAQGADVLEKPFAIEMLVHAIKHTI